MLDEALRIDPQHVTAWTARATAVRKLGDFRRAIQDATRAIEIDPKFAPAYTQRAFAYQQSEIDNRLEQSFADASKAIQLDPTSALSFILRGNVWLELEKYPQAIADFTKAITFNPRSYTAYSNRARCYFALGDVVKARRDVNKALSLNPAKDEAAPLQDSVNLWRNNPEDELDELLIAACLHCLWHELLDRFEVELAFAFLIENAIAATPATAHMSPVSGHQYD